MAADHLSIRVLRTSIRVVLVIIGSCYCADICTDCFDGFDLNSIFELFKNNYKLKRGGGVK